MATEIPKERRYLWNLFPVFCGIGCVKSHSRTLIVQLIHILQDFEQQQTTSKNKATINSLKTLNNDLKETFRNRFLCSILC